MPVGIDPFSKQHGIKCTFLSHDIGFILHKGYGRHLLDEKEFLPHPFNEDERYLVEAIKDGKIKVKFQTRVFFKFLETIGLSINRYSYNPYIFRCEDSISLDRRIQLLLDQPDETLRNLSIDKLVDVGVSKERIGFLSLDDRLALVRSYEYKEFY